MFLLLVLQFWFGGARLPKVIHHARPPLDVADVRAFANEQTGCVLSADGLSAKCAPESAFGKQGCETLTAPRMFGGLTPTMPIAVCSAIEHVNGAYLRSFGQPEFVGYERYVVATPDGFRMIGTLDELRAVYAPIDSADEALSYVLAYAILYPLYDFTPEANRVYYVRTIEETTVVKTPEGYRVENLMVPGGGCVPTPTYFANVPVSSDGIIGAAAFTKAWESK